MNGEKFIRVDLKQETTHNFNEHETLMSFYDDEGNYAFRDWWNEEGSSLFLKWCRTSKEYTDIDNTL